jgi:hypothetical protein
MVQMIAAGLAALMILVAALRGLRPSAAWRERAYAGAAALWTLFGTAIYHPALLGPAGPRGWVASPLLVTVFGFGLLALGVYGATLLLGGGDGAG